MPDTRLLRVAMPVPLRRLFDYLAPPDCTDDALQPGCRVRVPFGKGRTLVGMIVERPTRSDVPQASLKRALAAPDDSPLVPPPHLGFLLRASAYYQHPVGDALFQCLPGNVRRGNDTRPATETLFRLPANAPAPAGNPGRAPRQHLAMQLLAGAPNGLTSRALADNGISHSVLASLLEKGLVEKIGRLRASDTTVSPGIEPVALNPHQQSVASNMTATLGGFVVHALHGVTGSGKTEVYLAVMAAALERGLQALVLVPEIGLTPQFIDRVRRRIGPELAVVHSGLGAKERAQSWMDARDGRVRVVLGTRSAVWTPLANPGVIVVDEEHDLSYKQQDGFRYSARDMAVVRARDHGIPVILGSATPSLETVRNVAAGRYTEQSLPQRAGTAPPPTVTFIDLRGAQLHGAISARLLDALRTNLEQGCQSLLFLNRRGYAPALHCHQCGTVLACPRCDMPYTWHKQARRLVCHHCSSERAAQSQCPACKDSELVQLGHGTERLEETLATLLPAARILRIDRDSTRARGAMGRMMARAHAGDADILVGTQMLAKGHHLPNLTLVGIVDADRGLYSADFRAAERMAQLFVQVSGRAGRGNLPGQVLIQTHHPEHPLLRSLVEQGYGPFARLALKEREDASLPPCSCMAVLRSEHYEQAPAVRFLELARTLLQKAGPQLQVFGPLPSALERRAGRFRMQLIVQASRRSQLAQILPPWLQQLEKEPLGNRVRWSIDVDPQDML
jgi:primosomal protein N' (replication factor Y) (superfamily II helicase)